MNEKNKKALGALCLIGGAVVVAAVTLPKQPEGGLSFAGGGSGSGGTLSGFGDDLLSLDDLLNLIPVPEPIPEEPSILDESSDIAPLEPAAPDPFKAPEEPAKTGTGLTGFLKNAMDTTLVVNAVANPVIGIPTLIGIKAGQSVSAGLIDRIRGDEMQNNTQKAKTGGTLSRILNPAVKEQETKKSSGGGGTGKAKVVDTRTEQGQRDMSGASYVKIGRFANTGKSTGKVTIW